MQNLHFLDVDISIYWVLLVPLVTKKLPNNLLARKFENEKWKLSRI